MIVKNGFTYQFMFKYDGVLYGLALTGRGIYVATWRNIWHYRCMTYMYNQQQLVATVAAFCS